MTRIQTLHRPRRRVAFRPQADPLEGRQLFSIAGDLDPSFGTGGYMTMPSASASSTTYYPATAVTIDPGDRSIIVCGAYLPKGSRSDFALARLTPDGVLDPAFGSGGRVTTAFGNDNWDFAQDVVLDGQRILVAGNTQTVYARGGVTTNYHQFALARYDSHGQLDTSFGPDHNGKVATTIGEMVVNEQHDYGNAVAVQTFGDDPKVPKYVVAGQNKKPAGNTDSALVRYNENGIVDTSFGNGGMLVWPISTTLPDAINDVAVQLDNKIVVTGSVGSDLFVARLNENGSPDTTFGDYVGPDRSGIKVISMGSGVGSCGYSLALGDLGSIIVVGNAAPAGGPGDNVVLVKLSSYGTLATDFGTGGIALREWGPHYHPPSLAIQPDGKMIVVGCVGDGGAADTQIARFDESGQFDGTFGKEGNGKVLLPFSSLWDDFNGVAMQPDDVGSHFNIVAVGGCETNVKRDKKGNVFSWKSEYLVARYLGDGTAAPSPAAPVGLASGVSSTSAAPSYLGPVVPDQDLTQLATDVLNSSLKKRRWPGLNSVRTA